MRFLTDWRFILIYVGIAASIAALVMWGGSISPIDKHMQNKGSSVGGLTAVFKGESTGFGAAPKDSFEILGAERGTQFVYVKPEHVASRSTLRNIGAAVCQQAKSPSYCEVYFWNVREDVKVGLPVTRGDTLVAFYENKNGKVNLKLLQ